MDNRQEQKEDSS